MELVSVKKKLFFRIARNNHEYESDVAVTPELLISLTRQGVDIYTYLERNWCCPATNHPTNWLRTDDNIALLELTTFDAWWSAVGKKTRNMVRRAEKSGLEVKVAEPSSDFVEGIWGIYNETPIRQGRAFPHYGESLQSVTDNMKNATNSFLIGAYFDNKLVGFLQLLFGDRIVLVSQILSLQKHWDKAINNALIAKAVETCVKNGNKWLMYGRIGNHPSLDKFKESNGFKKFLITRYYIPLSWLGKLAIRLRMQREFKDSLPELIKKPLIPVFNWVSRNKALLKNKLRLRR